MGHENEILTRIADLRSKGFERYRVRADKKRYGNVLASVKTECGGGRLPGAEGEPAVPSSQVQIEDMENELQAIRRTYNAAATDYNNYIEMFPSSIIASQVQA